MNYYVGIDVSLEASSVCVVDGNGKIVREGEIASEPDALIAWLKGLKLELMRSRTAVAMALCSDAPSRTCGRTVGDTSRAQRAQDDAGEDRPQRRARNRAADSAGLVPPGALQVDRSAGDACAAHRAQAGAGKTS
jgi:hypothetical protein